MHRDNPSSECFKYVSKSLSCYGNTGYRIVRRRVKQNGDGFLGHRLSEDAGFIDRR